MGTGVIKALRIKYAHVVLHSTCVYGNLINNLYLIVANLLTNVSYHELFNTKIIKMINENTECLLFSVRCIHVIEHLEFNTKKDGQGCVQMCKLLLDVLPWIPAFVGARH